MAIESPVRGVLTQVEAEGRATRVSNVRYDLAIDLDRGQTGYRGDVTIAFDHQGDGDLFLDFRGGTIERLEIDGEIADVARTEHRIVLPGRLLSDRPRVRIAYRNEYDRNGEGFHHFRDPEDGREYLYTDFEPFDAHKFFPCFDQPDLKARYTVAVTAPADWEVTASSREIAREELPDGRARRRFEETVPFSTYIFAVIAGEYRVVRDEHEGVPLGLWCRQALAKYLDEAEVAEFFELTKQGFDFYREFFDQPYAFTKYDQIFVPEFNSGAMENTGAITFWEGYLYRDPPTERQREDRAETILHELAHMWFGNLTTMRWWDDLWLNESFATYMSYLAMTGATRFTDAWLAFTRLKRWASRQDQMDTTHAIAGEAPDTEVAFLNFDGITYGKGAAALQQLVEFLGADGFREGIRLYFRRHAFGNATLAEFLAALSEGARRPLGEWPQLWLETANLNQLEARWETGDGTLARLEVLQSAPPEHPTIRPHSLEVGLLTEDASGRLGIEGIRALVETPVHELSAARGRPAPLLVYPNHNDRTYAKVVLDRESARFAARDLARVPEPMLRQLLWASVWEMVRDGTFSSLDYLRMAREALTRESDLGIVEFPRDTLERTLRTFVPDEHYDQEAGAWFAAALDTLRAARSSDARITWARIAIGAAVRRDDVAALLRILDGEDPIDGFAFDQEMRWAIVRRATVHGLDPDGARAAAEHDRDRSDRGEREMVRIAAARPSPDAKAEAWERFVGPGYGYGSWALTEAAMSGFNSRTQRELLRPYVDRFFDDVPRVFGEREPRFASSFATLLFPEHAIGPELLRRVERSLQEDGRDIPTMRRRMRELIDDLQRALRARSVAEELRLIP